MVMPTRTNIIENSYHLANIPTNNRIAKTHMRNAKAGFRSETLLEMKFRSRWKPGQVDRLKNNRLIISFNVGICQKIDEFHNEPRITCIMAYQKETILSLNDSWECIIRSLAKSWKHNFSWLWNVKHNLRSRNSWRKTRGRRRTTRRGYRKEDDHKIVAIKSFIFYGEIIPIALTLWETQSYRTFYL